MSITARQTEGLQFHLKHIARLETLQLSPLFEHVDAEMTSMMLEQASRFASESLVDLAASGDVTGCVLENGHVRLPEGTLEAYQLWCELGFPALGLPLENDGLGFPRVVQCAIQELFDGANPAFGMMAINLRCAAMAVLKNADAAIAEKWVPGLVSGQVASTISISEPQAGSDVGRIRTSAEPQDDGSWLVSGSKIWISYADHDLTEEVVHLVLARVPNDEVGTRGLGLFLVPAERDSSGRQTNGITILRLEHKMGLHASPTCVMDFDNSRGHLVGEAGRGLQALFVMMNAMRLAVGIQGAAAACAATAHAINYAVERPQGGKPTESALMISEHADVRRMLLEMTAQSELCRALAMRTASALDQAEAHDGNAAKAWLTIAELMLPVTKTLNAETAFSVASQGIQVLGGYGYTNDYPIERIARDIRVASVYEGTSGIQALDFLKRRVMADDCEGLKQFIDLVRKETEIGNSPFSADIAGICQLLDETAKNLCQSEIIQAEAGAYALLQLTGLVANAWNGHTLYCAATGNCEYENMLKAALEFYAGSIAENAACWAARAAQPLPQYRFEKG